MSTTTQTKAQRLIRLARARGLTVEAVGTRLQVEAPRREWRLANRLWANEVAVVRELRREGGA